MFDAPRTTGADFDEDFVAALEAAGDSHSLENDRPFEMSGAAAAILAEAELKAELPRDQSRTDALHRDDRTRAPRSR